MMKFAIPAAVVAFLVAASPSPAEAAQCKCHKRAAHKAHATSKPKKVVKVRKVTTKKYVTREVHYAPPQIVERVKTVYVDRPVERTVYVDRPVERIKTVYVDRPVDRPVYVDRPVPVDRTVYVDRPVDRPVYVDRPVPVDRPVAVPVDRAVYVDRPVPVDRPVYVERRVAVPVPVYRNRVVVRQPVYVQNVRYRRHW